MNRLIETFSELYESNRLRFDESMSLHTSFKIGGPADIYAIPETQAEFIHLVTYAIENKMQYFVLGRGSNLLVSDKGIRAIVISTECLKKITLDENYISAYCGVKLSDLCGFAQQVGLSGLEFASGIPGSVGGAVYMNAGAYKGEIKDVLYCSKCIDPTLETLKSSSPILHLKADAHEFSYRNSILQAKGYIHLSSVFKLKVDAHEAIKERMDELEYQRNSKQPMELPSAGSVFKRPDGHFTGQLVDDCEIGRAHV